MKKHIHLHTRYNFHSDALTPHRLPPSQGRLCWIIPWKTSMESQNGSLEDDFFLLSIGWISGSMLLLWGNNPLQVTILSNKGEQKGPTCVTFPVASSGWDGAKLTTKSLGRVMVTSSSIKKINIPRIWNLKSIQSMNFHCNRHRISTLLKVVFFWLSSCMVLVWCVAKT